MPILHTTYADARAPGCLRWPQKNTFFFAAAPTGGITITFYCHKCHRSHHPLTAHLLALAALSPAGLALFCLKQITLAS